MLPVSSKEAKPAQIIYCHPMETPTLLLDSVFQIEDSKITNASILLQIDNANMATEDFRLK